MNKLIVSLSLCLLVIVGIYVDEVQRQDRVNQKILKAQTNIKG